MWLWDKFFFLIVPVCMSVCHSTLLHTRLHVLNIVIIRTSGRNLYTFKRSSAGLDIEEVHAQCVAACVVMLGSGTWGGRAPVGSLT